MAIYKCPHCSYESNHKWVVTRHMNSKHKVQQPQVEGYYPHHQGYVESPQYQQSVNLPYPTQHLYNPQPVGHLYGQQPVNLQSQPTGHPYVQHPYTPMNQPYPASYINPVQSEQISEDRAEDEDESVSENESDSEDVAYSENESDSEDQSDSEDETYSDAESDSEHRERQITAFLKRRVKDIMKIKAGFKNEGVYYFTHCSKSELYTIFHYCNHAIVFENAKGHEILKKAWEKCRPIRSDIKSLADKDLSRQRKLKILQNYKIGEGIVFGLLSTLIPLLKGAINC